jgi:hypothetical protein
MTRLFVRHNLADYTAWRKAYHDVEAERKAVGVTAHAVFKSHRCDCPARLLNIAKHQKLRLYRGTSEDRGVPVEQQSRSQANSPGHVLDRRPCRVGPGNFTPSLSQNRT